MKVDVYEQVTERVLAMMEEHGANWINPFAKRGGVGRPVNVASGKAYRGINVLLLGWSGGSQYWGTYKQWTEKGGQVRKGEKSSMILFWKMLQKEEDGQIKTIPVLRTYSVFSAAQQDGWTPPDQAEIVDEVEVIAEAEAFFGAVPADVRHGTDGRAFFSPLLDFVQVPEKRLFEATPTSTATECYYSTLAHELVHWTGHKSRLDRLSRGVEEYAREELVAEIGAALLCASLGISSEPRADHAQYLNAWMKRLRDHKREFVSAASAAAKAVALLESYSQAEEMQEAA